MEIKIITTIIILLILRALIAFVIEKFRQKIRDKAAHEVLDKTFNYEKEKIEILDINRNLSFLKGKKCPNCSGALVLCRGMYGPFLGCSNYPKCEYTKRFH